MFTPAEQSAMVEAVRLAGIIDHPLGPNPRVGAVLLDHLGQVVANGYHRGPGTPHAEIDALAAAGTAAQGCTAVVTLEPCNHTGQTGPCSEALIAAGVARVIYAMADPNPVASGGDQTLRAAGIDVEVGLLGEEALAINAEWSVAVTRSRPFVTLKLAATLDGRVAAADGTSQWITGPAARADVHRLRSKVDAVAVGTGTALTDDPQLTDRRADAGDYQPVRVVMGERSIPEDAQVLDAAADSLVIGTRDLSAGLSEIFARGIRQMLLEGGPTLATAFLRADLVDRLIWYVAPKLLGAGRPAVGELGIESVSDAFSWRPVEIAMLEADVRLTLDRIAKEA
ncbi:MAG: bifunctional diaminohydroxyphosphoribosylaminopyrimidine deaminase/5-amino-6-(5-phosphoribosylamino)uracil reductase RibD [Candidatus Nanopelagicales bacterium]